MGIKIKTLLSLLMLGALSNLSAAQPSKDSCWSSVEVAEFAQDEFSEIARFSIKDAVSCKPLANAKFSIGGATFSADERGVVTLPLPPQDVDANIPVTISKPGYITSKESVMVVFGSYWNNLFVMSKELPLQSARFVLSWSDKPADLDLHLKSDDFHISFRKIRSIKNKVQLDRDARHGYGPETITLNKLSKTNNYRVLVDRYSQDGNINDKAQVRIYRNNKLDKVVRLPNTSARCIEVATIKNNTITYKTKELDRSECRR